MEQIRSVMERKREIGIMRALGARGWQVAIVFWVVAIIFSVSAAYGFLQLFLSNAVQSYVPFAYDNVSSGKGNLPRKGCFSHDVPRLRSP